MNTRAVAKLLGISTSSVQRWVKQLNLEMERNEQGHFIFSEEDIELLKQVKLQLQNGVLLQDISFETNKRSGIAKKTHPELNIDKLAETVKQIETSLHQKADSVVSYQILQHRREIDELQDQILLISERLAKVEEFLQKETQTAMASEMDHSKGKKLTRKKKKFLQIILGLF